LTEDITVSPGHLFDTGNIVETTFPITGSGSSVSTDLEVDVDTGWITIASIIGEDWGIWNSMIAGTAESQQAPDWLIEFSNETGSYFGVQNIEAFPDGPEELDAVHGAWADLSTVMPATGILSGALTGTFDPNSMFPLPNRWMADGAGAWIETNKFLELADPLNTAGNEALAALNIPFIEVGRTDLTGSGGNLTSVNMNDVTFFAYSTGDPAKIWATGDVNGTFTSGSNPLGDTAILNGSGTGANFSDVNFTVNNWAGGTWGATVDGSGTVGTIIPYNVNINGVAAGTVDSATEFSGTGAGVATTQEALEVP
jgi:hypothetical protein